MSNWLAPAHLVDAILLLVTVEALALVLLHRFAGLGPRLRVLLPNLLAGACLLLALRLVVLEASSVQVAAALGAAGIAHALDLVLRWRDS